ncbi:NADH:flavin oxidoreductase [Schinkia azotoformans MEV2011]|uniref:NADH:flavin oxidoreductase n=1 Tax=Schinkia azotoformans MEV2011 TaxID=1348973 RepID=A0A072NEM4_SCHAZ|nr:NAD(P)/FAD-dependent oxidoreductase [Schinkia azotoformans]KEF36099.1 NADH:flavin oxidoreductase [Schinkia azotoformans MEV2011]MEC1773020.1 NAD(P)/FAD-dependent oxidoreductase [Schinkia azotoformans]MED4369247.1 NAD(P)/FAD-dependent oxidoreductase [Schinkia azotoformans]
METRFKKLFTPGKIGKVELKNRILKAPQSTGLSNMDGTVSERLVRHYKELAQGGTGLIIVEYTYIDDDASKSAYCQLGISKNEHISGLSWLVSAIHDEGAKVGIQLEHCGRQKFLATPPIKAPSRIPWPHVYEQTGYIPEELTIQEIKQIIESFGDAAKRAKMAGFDLVEIHAAHGYLITNFLSNHTNKRTDLYGGSLENRMRFLIEVIQNIKAKVGENFPVTMRINGTDYEPDGITIEETIEVCKRAEELGIAAFHVSGGDHHMMNYQVSPMTVPNGPNVWAAEAIKKVVSVPVIASGSITTPQFAEQILQEKNIDFVSFGRPLLADPYFPLKAKEGRPEEIKPCIRCNDGCLERTFFNFNSIRCTVNPNMGREGELNILPAKTPRNIAVVGGGPAGMEAALVSAERGHKVTLFEKNQLGGALLASSVQSFKTDLRNLENYYSAQMKKLDINIVREEATATIITNGDFDAVIVAVGKVPNTISVQGLDETITVQATDILLNKAEAGHNVVIIGSGTTGIETALYLADKGHNVSVIEQSKNIKNHDQVTYQISYNQMLQEKDIAIYVSAEIKGADQGLVKVVLKNGEEKEIVADNVILATGYKANNQLVKELKEQTNIEVYHIGDSKEPGKIFDAIHSGYLTGLRL